MTAMINTLKFAKSFETAGFAKPQAEAIVFALAEATSMSREDLVTKADLQVAVADLKSEIVSANATTRSQLPWAMFGGQLVLLGARIALSKFAHLFA